MRCPKCDKEGLIGAEYCIRCGASLYGRGEPGGKLGAAEDGLPEVRRQLKEMGLRLSVVEGRVMLISERIELGAPESPSDEERNQVAKTDSEPESLGEWFPNELLNAPKAAPDARVAPAVPGPVAPAKGPAADRERVTPSAAGAAKASAVPARAPQGPPKPRQPSRAAAKMREWEQALPGNWLSRIGMLALFIGLGFLAEYMAYDRGWIGPVPQLLAGLGCGALFLLAGHHWRQVYRGWAQAITGGGIGILYLSVFGSYGLHHLMPFWATFLLMFLVTLLAVGIALRRDSMSIAILGIVGAFLVPITLGAVDQSADGTGGTGGNNTSLMAAYILTLDVGVVGLASLRNWRWFTLLGFGGSMAVFGLWYGTSDRDSAVGAAEGLMTGIFLCFAAATTLFHGLKRHRPQLTDLALMTLNAVVYFGVTHYLLWDSHRDWLGLLGFGLAAFHGAMGYLFLRRSKENGLLAAFASGIAIVFLTVAIPVQLEKSWMTAAWAAEGAVLIWLAVRYGTPRWQLWGLGAFALAVVRLFAFDQFVDRADFTPVVNDMFWAFAPAAAAFLTAAWCLRHREKALQPWLFPVMVLSASFLTIWLLSFEVINFAGSRITAGQAAGTGYDVQGVKNARNLVLVALWAAYGLGVMIAGLRRGWWWLRAQGLVLALMAIGMTMVTLNYGRFLMEEGPAHPIGNYSFGAFAICIGLVVVVAGLAARNRERLDPGEKALFPALVLLANFLVLWAVSSEVIAFMHGLAQNLVLVAIWCTYGLGLLTSGIGKKWAWLRVAAYVMAVAACGATLLLLNHRVAGVDSGSDYLPLLNPSLGAFAICVAALYLGACVMARYREGLLKFELTVRTVALAAASALTVWGLSEEVVAFIGGVNLRSLVLVVVWAGYGCLLMTVGVLRRGLLPRVGGCALLALAAVVTMATLNHGHAGIGPEDDWPILNYGFGGFAVCILASYIYAWLTARSGDEARRFDRVVCWVALATASVLTIWAASAEVTTFVAGVNVRNLVLVILWSGYGALVMAAGSLKGAPAARFAGYALVAAAIGLTMTMLNHGQPGLGGAESRPMINAAFGGCLVCVAVLYLLAWVMYRNSSRLLDGEKAVLAAIIVVANALSLFALSSEVWTYAGDDQGKNMGLTVLWAAYGLLMMVAGIMGRWPWVRLGGLGLVSVAILKLFLYDMVKLGGGYRVAAFVITGVLLLAGGFVYHRYVDVIKGFIMNRPEQGTSSARK